MLFMKVETYANKHSLEILVVCEKGILLYSKTKPNMGHWDEDVLFVA